MINNLFVEYVETARKRIYKYIKLIFKKEYDQEIAEIYIDNYINARYYNLSYKETSRVFYLRIKEILLKVMQELLTKNEKEKALEKAISKGHVVTAYKLKQTRPYKDMPGLSHGKGRGLIATYQYE